MIAAADLTARACRVRLLSCDVDGVLTDGRVYVAEDGSELKAYSCLDGLGMKWLERSGIVVAWITGSSALAVARRAATLGISRVVQGVENKLEAWELLRTELALEPEECAHIGDDFPDLPVIVRCGLAATVPAEVRQRGAFDGRVVLGVVGHRRAVGHHADQEGPALASSPS